MNKDLAQIKQKLEIPMIIMALLSIPVLSVHRLTDDPTLRIVSDIMNVIIWLAFLGEFLLILILSPKGQKKGVFKEYWLNIVIVLVTIPLLVPESWQLARLLRILAIGKVFGILKLIRLFILSRRVVLGARRVFSPHQFQYVVILLMLLIVVGGSLLFFLEDENLGSIGNGWWLAITTVTTVGYGDMAPVTWGGKIIALLLMVLGIGFVAVLTAQVASFFISEDSEKDREATQEIQEKVIELNQKIDKVEMELREIKRLLQENKDR